MSYEYGVLNPKRDEKTELDNAKLLGPRTLGIEVTVPSLASRCGLGNIDPQHGEGAMAKQAAIEAAVEWPLPAAGSRLVTMRVDLDAVGAMAVLACRAKGFLPCERIAARIRLIGEQDRFDRGPWPGVQPLPRDHDAFVRACGADGPLAPLNAAMKDRALDLPGKVCLVQSWLRNGSFLGIDGYWAKALAHAGAIALAVREGRVVSETTADGRIAVVSADVEGALSVIGYRLAPVVVAQNPAYLFADGKAGRKWTIAQYRHGHVDMAAAVRELNAVEDGWGGSPTIIGSP